MTRSHRLQYGVVLVLCLLFSATPAVTAPSNPYEAASSGYFRDMDTLPGAYTQYQKGPQGRGSLWGIGPGGGNVKRSSFQADAHEGVFGYASRTCVSCHDDMRYSLHTSRGNVTCVQCHRQQPIAGVHHYYSALNPIRRHAYVCAKCHEGASNSFATYVIHEPRPLLASTKDEFPAFYYGVWIMVILAVGVFVLFLPYVTLWGLRELVGMFTRGDH